MLDAIVKKQQSFLAEVKKARPLKSFANKISVGRHAFAQKIFSRDWSLVAECKLKSPVKGELCLTQSVEGLARIYEQNGAAALSVHTNEHFAGCLADLEKVRAASSLPIMRKEFVLDAYQLYETAYCRADAVLLIARILTGQELAGLIGEAAALGLDCLVEAHDREDIEKSLAAGARLLGLNNRDLRDFSTNIALTLELLPYCGEAAVISESGFKSRADALAVQQGGARGALVGEGLVVAQDIAAKTRELALIEEDGR